MSKPVFSLLHVSARPDGWRAAFDAWTSRADNPGAVEYLLCVDKGGAFDNHSAGGTFSALGLRLIWNHGRPCVVDAWNTAAKASTGRVLVCVADDFFPPLHWDSLLLAAIPDLEEEYAVHVNAQDPWPWIMTHPILTRAYYERPGRGGCPNGELFYPEYISVGSDDDFTLVAQRDGVIVDARASLKFEHRHPLKKLGTVLPGDADAVYCESNRAEAWRVKDRVLGKRARNGFTGGVDPLKSLVVVTPGTPFDAVWLAEWDELHFYLRTHFAFGHIYSQSNNIYQVRIEAARAVLLRGTPDYVLWIDSDNPPTIAAFQALMSDLQASERNTDPLLRPIDIVGAWYRYKGPDTAQSYIAAGRSFGMADFQLTEAEVLDALKRGRLIDDLAFIGFGLLLMRGSVLAELGPRGFVPQPVEDERGFLTDDVSWCFRAKRAGHLIYLNPAAHVEHLKLGPVEPPRHDLIPISGFRPKQLEEVAV